MGKFCNDSMAGGYVEVDFENVPTEAVHVAFELFKSPKINPSVGFCELQL